MQTAHSIILSIFLKSNLPLHHACGRWLVMGKSMVMAWSAGFDVGNNRVLASAILL